MKTFRGSTWYSKTSGLSIISRHRDKWKAKGSIGRGNADGHVQGRVALNEFRELQNIS
jgi:hypothetical protein